MEGGWKAIKALRGVGERIKGDERILGDGHGGQPERLRMCDQGEPFLALGSREMPQVSDLRLAAPDKPPENATQAVTRLMIGAGLGVEQNRAGLRHSPAQRHVLAMSSPPYRSRSSNPPAAWTASRCRTQLHVENVSAGTTPPTA